MKESYKVTLITLISMFLAFGSVILIGVCVEYSFHKEKPILEPISDEEYERWKNLPEPVVQLPENYSLTFVLPDGRKVELSPNDTENMIEKALKENDR